MTAQIINLAAYREPVRYRPEVGQMFRLNELYARVLQAQENGWCWCEVKSRDGAKHYTSWVHLSDLHPLRNDERPNDRPSDTEEA